jgi:hypothetical protein
MTGAPNSVRCWVEDAGGQQFLWTSARGLAYEAKFREHAAWWIKYATRPGAHKDTDSAGRPVPRPTMPCRVIVEPFYDPTSDEHGQPLPVKPKRRRRRT